MKKALIATAAILAACFQPAFAGNVSGKIVYIETIAHVIFIHFDEPPQGAPACATETGASRRFAIRTTTPEGKAMMTSAMVAFTTGRSVVIAGTNACGDWGDTESVYSLKMWQ